jgi:hypothetical protein
VLVVLSAAGFSVVVCCNAVTVDIAIAGAAVHSPHALLLLPRIPTVVSAAEPSAAVLLQV